MPTPSGLCTNELKITWFSLCLSATLLSMEKRPIQPGRPRGSLTADPTVAKAFGAAVRSMRTTQGVAQEALANIAKIERAHVGKIERGEHMPTLAAVLKLARALGVSSAVLMQETEARLPPEYIAPHT